MNLLSLYIFEIDKYYTSNNKNVYKKQQIHLTPDKTLFVFQTILPSKLNDLAQRFSTFGTRTTGGTHKPLWWYARL